MQWLWLVPSCMVTYVMSAVRKKGDTIIDGWGVQYSPRNLLWKPVSQQWCIVPWNCREIRERTTVDHSPSWAGEYLCLVGHGEARHYFAHNIAIKPHVMSQQETPCDLICSGHIRRMS